MNALVNCLFRAGSSAMFSILLTILQGGSKPALYLQWQPGLLDEPSLGATLVAAGDVNLDGFADLLVSNQSSAYSSGHSQVSLISSAAGDTLLTWSSISSQYGHYLLGPGDLNSDGVPDVLIMSGRDFLAYSGLNGSWMRTYVTSLSSSADYDGLIAMGDVDFDGVPDFAYSSSDHDIGSLSSVGIIAVVSGASGAEIFTVTGSSAYDELGTEIALLHDQNGDGVDEILAVASWQRRVRLYSGHDGALLREFAGPRPGEDLWRPQLADAGDVDHDGLHDFIAGLPSSTFAGAHKPGAALLISSATGALLRAWDGVERDEAFGYDVSGGGDLDGDGSIEVLIRSRLADSGSFADTGRLHLFDAATGAAIAVWEGSRYGQMLGQGPAFIDDTSGDGRDDLVFGLGQKAPERLQIWSWEAWLRADSRVVSASAPSIVSWDVDFPQPAAGAQFRMLISASGRGPMIRGITIPLTPDALLRATAQGNYSPPILPLRMMGTLDASGNAEAACAFLAGSLTPWIGRTLYVAAVALHASGRPLACSSALDLRIMP